MDVTVNVYWTAEWKMHNIKRITAVLRYETRDGCVIFFIVVRQAYSSYRSQTQAVPLFPTADAESGALHVAVLRERVVG